MAGGIIAQFGAAAVAMAPKVSFNRVKGTGDLLRDVVFNFKTIEEATKTLMEAITAVRGEEIIKIDKDEYVWLYPHTSKTLQQIEELKKAQEKVSRWKKLLPAAVWAILSLNISQPVSYDAQIQEVNWKCRINWAQIAPFSTETLLILNIYSDSGHVRPEAFACARFINLKLESQISDSKGSA